MLKIGEIGYCIHEKSPYYLRNFFCKSKSTLKSKRIFSKLRKTVFQSTLVRSIRQNELEDSSNLLSS